MQIRCCFTTIYLLYCVFFINTFAKVTTHESQWCSLKTRQPESSGVESSGSLGDSLVTKWLELCPSIAGGMGLIPGQGTKILHTVWHVQKKSRSALLYLKWISNKALLYSTGTLLNVMWQFEWEGSLKNGYMFIFLTESLWCPPETITTLLISCIPI